MAFVRQIPLKGDYSNKFHSNREIINESTQSKVKKKNEKQIDDYNEKQKTFKDNQAHKKIIDKTKENVVENAYVKGSEYIFTKELCEIYINSLNIDEDFINENRETIENFFISKLKETTNDDIYSFMGNVKGNSNFLTNLVEKCKTKGKCISKKVDEECNSEKCGEGCNKSEDCNKDDSDNKSEGCNKSEKCNESYKDDSQSKTVYQVNSIFTKVCDEEEKKNALDVNMDNEEISNTIKDKVLGVIETEEEISKKKQELIDDLAASNEDLQENIKLFRKDPIESHTLFHSIMMNKHKKCINELNESNDIGNYGSIDSDGNVSINMDYILCDTLLEYTVLELFNTTKMINYTNSDIRELAESYAYSK